MSDIAFVIRPAKGDDHPFIVDSFCMSFRGQARARSFGQLFLRDYKWFVRELLKRAECRVACLADDPDLILGWAMVHSRYVVTYAFTKQDFRHNGIATALLADELKRTDIVYTHSSHQLLRIPDGWLFAPMADLRLLVNDAP